MKKRCLSLFMAVILTIVMAACGQQETAEKGTEETKEENNTESKEETSDNKLKFAYVVRDTGSIYSQYITDFEEACEEAGAESVIISYENDTAKWPDALENAVTVGADAVYSWPDDQSMADYAAKYYKEQGIPHCVMGIDAAEADCVMVGDQAAMGKQLAEQCAAWVEGNLGDESFEWALLEYTSAEHVAARSQAMEDTMTELCANGTQVAALEAQTL